MKKTLVHLLVIGLLCAPLSAPREALARGGRAGGGGGGGSFSHAGSSGGFHANTFSRPSSSFHSANIHTAPINAGGRSFAQHPGNFAQHVGNFGRPVGAAGLGGRSFAGHVGGVGVGGFRPNYYGNWYHGNWQGHWGGGWGYWPVGWGGYGFGNGLAFGLGAGIATVGLMAATSPYNWGYYNYSNPYWTGPVAGMPYIDYSQPMVGGQGGYPPQAYGAGGYAGQPYGGQAYPGQALPAQSYGGPGYGAAGYGGAGYGGAGYGGQPPYPPGQPIAGQPGAGQPGGPPGGSQPLSATAGYAGNPGGPDNQALAIFDGARNQFLQGNYQAALDQVNQALASAPKDPVLNEFRGLCLFALGDYQQAAAADYAVLSTSPGWDWTTMSSFYPNVEAYTRQLRALESYSQQHPNAAEARFLLAYQYLREGYNDQATAELQAVTQLEPGDQLAAQLLRGLTTPATPPSGNPQAGGQLAGGQSPLGQSQLGQSQLGQPPAGAQAQPAAPIAPGSLLGNWSASRPDGSTFKLQLTDENKFVWKFGSKDKQQTLTGTYTLADNYLILKGNDQNSLVGQVTPEGGNHFNFRLAGNNPADPGLDFTR